MEKMDVSIIYVNYNSTEFLIQSINSVIEHTKGVNYEIIVVDNNSPDKGIVKIEEIFGDKIVVVKSDKNLGFGGANNLGSEKARGAFLFFLNPDTQLLNDSISFFYEFAHTSKEVIGTLGSILLNDQRKANHSYGSFLTPVNVLCNSLPLHKRDITSFIDNPIEVDYITGADLFMPSSVFKKIGGFDESFFMYSEEVDLQYRISKEGYKRIIIPGPNIIHFDGGSYDKSKPSARRRYEKDKSRIHYVKKHYGRFAFVIFKVCMLFVKFPVLINKRYNISENIHYYKMIINC